MNLATSVDSLILKYTIIKMKNKTKIKALFFWHNQVKAVVVFLMMMMMMMHTNQQQHGQN